MLVTFSREVGTARALARVRRTCPFSNLGLIRTGDDGGDFIVGIEPVSVRSFLVTSMMGPGFEDHPNCPPLPIDLRVGIAATRANNNASSNAAPADGNTKLCAACGSAGGNLKACAGTCGGKVSYCGRECQAADFKLRHKKECWKKADTDTFFIPHPNDSSKGPIKLKAYRRLDGFDKDGVALTYNDDVNEEPSIDMVWCLVTSPVHDDADRSSLKAGEAVFNMTKYRPEVEALIRHGIVKYTGRKIKIGYYSPHPVCRINLPLTEDADEDDY